MKEGWTDKLPLKYDDKTYGDRFGLQFFAEHFNSEILSDSSDQYDIIFDDFGQIFDAFSLMALNLLMTENDVNELKAKAAAGKDKLFPGRKTTFLQKRVAVLSCMHICMHVCTYVSMYECMYVCM